MQKRHRRADRWNGEIYDDWYEQQLAELKDGDDSGTDRDADLFVDIVDTDGRVE